MKLRFRCPFCGKRAEAVEDPPAVTHAVPVCSTFERLEIDEYLIAVRGELVVESKKPS